jgi:hypothetical protein
LSVGGRHRAETPTPWRTALEQTRGEARKLLEQWWLGARWTMNASVLRSNKEFSSQLQETKVFATQLLHRNRKMKDLFPPSSFTKTIGNHSLVERLDPLPMVVLLKIEGNCSCVRAKVAHMVGHLPATPEQTKATNQGRRKSKVTPPRMGRAGSLPVVYSEGSESSDKMYRARTDEK